VKNGLIKVSIRAKLKFKWPDYLYNILVRKHFLDKLSNTGSSLLWDCGRISELITGVNKWAPYFITSYQMNAAQIEYGQNVTELF